MGCGIRSCEHDARKDGTKEPHFHYPFIERHLGCLYFLAIVNTVAMSITEQSSVGKEMSNPLGICLGLISLDFMIDSFLALDSLHRFESD